MAVPCLIAVYAGAAAGFAQEHIDCQPSEGGLDRFRYATAEEWYRSWDTGVSSLTIFSVFMRYGRPTTPDIPRDPADFGRCYRLLALKPDWRAELQQVASRYPAWQPLVDCWNELSLLYEEEAPGGDALRLYARMRELLE